MTDANSNASVTGWGSRRQCGGISDLCCSGLFLRSDVLVRQQIAARLLVPVSGDQQPGHRPDCFRPEPGSGMRGAELDHWFLWKTTIFDCGAVKPPPSLCIEVSTFWSGISARRRAESPGRRTSVKIVRSMERVRRRTCAQPPPVMTHQSVDRKLRAPGGWRSQRLVYPCIPRIEVFRPRRAEVPATAQDATLPAMGTAQGRGMRCSRRGMFEVGEQNFIVGWLAGAKHR